jgi:hypothetical protein
VAYVQEVSLRDKRCIIGHFAVVRGRERTGLGRGVAITFFREINDRHGVTEILFSERSTRYYEANYPAFFSALGAREVSPTRRGSRPEHLWTIDCLYQVSAPSLKAV